MVFLSISVVGSVFQPMMIKHLQNRMFVILAMITTWFLMCVPFSVHRGGSVRLLIGYWLTTVLACVCVMVIGQTLQSTRRLLYSIVSGVILVLLLSIATGSNPELQKVIGGLTNPNLYGQHLLFALPFLCIPVFLYGLFSLRGILASAGAVLILLKVVFTGSRASFLAIAVMFFLLFLRLSFMKKLLMVAASLPAMMTIYILMPQLAKDRYATILSSDGNAEMSIDAIGAIESANSRKLHFQQSIELTFLNPVFGVGPGMFPVASAEHSEELGEKAFWKETHNTYSQISSESGIPGLILYVAMLITMILAQWKVIAVTRRAPEHSPLAECGIIAYCLFLSTAATIVTGTFSSIGYQIYFPLLGAFSAVVLRLTSQEIAVARNNMATAAKTAAAVPDARSRRLPGMPQPLAYPRAGQSGTFAQ